jgi:hypothetical protein
MANAIKFVYQGLTIDWNPDGPRDLQSLLDEARAVRAALDELEGAPTGPGRTPAPTERPRTPAEAEARFYARYGWPLVQRLLGRIEPRPQSVDGWIAVAEEVRDRQRAA